jgi:Flp pilus assembly protein TadG
VSRRGRVRRWARDHSGAGAVEFALVIIPFMLVMFGVVEFGRMLWTLNALQETAIAGARCMGVLNTSCASSGAYNAGNTTTYVKSIATGWGVSLATTNITLNNSTACGGVAGFSQVSISYTFQTVIPMITSLVGDPLTVNACFPNQV